MQTQNPLHLMDNSQDIVIVVGSRDIEWKNVKRGRGTMLLIMEVLLSDFKCLITAMDCEVAVHQRSRVMFMLWL